MDQTDGTLRAVLLGHLAITVPSIVVIPLLLWFGLYMYGPFSWPYYISGGLAIAWQWYTMALPSWKESLTDKGVSAEETEVFASRNGLFWSGASSVGLFALHTTAAALCGIHFGPWLLSRWFAWIVPLTGMAHHAPTGNDWLQHFELSSILPAFVAGYILRRYFRRMATCAWILPTIILAYKLLTFAEPNASVLALHSSTRFSYFFDIQRSFPTFFGGGDPVRVAQQIFVLAPFYAGVAYSIGALASSHGLFEKFFRHSRSRGPEAEPRNEVEKPA